MKKFDLNIGKILPDWEIKHAIREIIANALDEEKLTTSQEIQIFKDTSGYWHIRDFGRGIRIENFTQDENTDKLSNQRVIGKFGIGLKDAIATFDRHQVDIKIESKYGEFTVGKSSKQDFEEVETLHVYPKQSLNPSMVGTDFIIKNIVDSDIDDAKRFFLKFSNVKILEETKYGEIIGKKTSIGYIYINDVLVAQEENFLFSYNITFLTAAIKKALNRERTNVGKTAYSPSVKQILLNSQTEEVQQILVDDFKIIDTGTSHDELNWRDIQEYAAKLLNNPNVLYVTKDDLTDRVGLINEAKGSGKDIVFIPTALHEKITGQSDFGGVKIQDLKQYASDRNESFEYHFVSYENLNSQEKQVYDKMYPLLMLIGGKPHRVKEILISETTQKESDSYEPATGVWDDPQIIIKRSQLSSSEAFLGTLLHEIAHAKSYASDVTRRFEQELTSMLGKLASLAVNGENLPQPKETIVNNNPTKEALNDSYLPSIGTRIPVKSSAIRAIGYNEQTLVLQIEFKSQGSIYEYYNVPKTMFVEFMNAESKNGFGNRMIYHRYTSKRIK